MLLEKFKAHLDKLFKLVPTSKEASDLREEMLGNLMSRAMELQAEGVPEESIYEICIESLGNYSPLVSKLQGHPIAIVRDAKFQKSVVLSLAFALLCVTVYLVLGFVIKDFWGLGAIIIFPTMAVGLYLLATGSLLRRNVKFGKHLTTDAILSSYCAILMVALFFILWQCAGISAGKAWVTFTAIPVLCVASAMFTTGVLRKKRIPLLIILVFIITASVQIFLAASAFTGLWHPLWVIVVGGVLICGFVIVVKAYAKIDEKQNKR